LGLRAAERAASPHPGCVVGRRNFIATCFLLCDCMPANTGKIVSLYFVGIRFVCTGLCILEGKAHDLFLIAPINGTYNVFVSLLSLVILMD
jgi:hypothetical protein